MLIGARKALFAKPRFWPLADGAPPAWYADFAASKYKYNSSGSSFAAWLASLGGTYSRASTAIYFNSSGVLTQAASGELRYDYDQVTHAAKGILLEGARTNICTYSNSFGSWEGIARSSVLSNIATAPTGTAVACKLVDDSTASDTHHINTAALSSITAGATITASIYLAAAEYSKCVIFVSNGSASSGFQINIDIGAVTTLNRGNVGTGELTMSSIVYVGTVGGLPWYRVQLTGTVDAASTTTRFYLYLNNGSGLTFNGANGSGVYLYGAQLEAGAFASSYIPTTSSSATRAADSLTFPTSPWFNASAGTFFAELDTFSPNPNHARIIADTGSNNAIIYEDNTKVGTWNGSVVLQQVSALNLVAISRAIIAYSAAGRAITGAGLSPATDANLLQAMSSDLKIGGDVGDADAFYGHIRKVGYWPFRVTNAELQRLTT